jgi:hypothetical protein
MSMYKFVKGSRLFMQAKRDVSDFDNIHDDSAAFHPTQDDRARGGYWTTPRAHSTRHDHDKEDEVRAVHTMRSMNVEGNTEWERSGRTVRSGGVKSRSTRTVRKVTTVTRGEQSVTSESVMRYSSDNAAKYPQVARDKKSLKFRVVDDKVMVIDLLKGFAVTRRHEARGSSWKNF